MDKAPDLAFEVTGHPQEPGPTRWDRCVCMSAAFEASLTLPDISGNYKTDKLRTYKLLT